MQEQRWPEGIENLLEDLRNGIIEQEEGVVYRRTREEALKNLEKLKARAAKRAKASKKKQEKQELTIEELIYLTKEHIADQESGLLESVMLSDAELDE